MSEAWLREGAQWALLLAIEQHVPEVLTDLRDYVLPVYRQAMFEQPDYRNRGLAYLIDDLDKRLASVPRAKAGEESEIPHDMSEDLRRRIEERMQKGRKRSGDALAQIARRLEKQKAFREALVAWAVEHRISDADASVNRWVLEAAVATLHRWADQPRTIELRWRYPGRMDRPRLKPGEIRWREKVETDEPVAKREFRWLARYVIGQELRYVIDPDVTPASFSAGHKKAARWAGFEILPPP